MAAPQLRGSVRFCPLDYRYGCEDFKKIWSEEGRHERQLEVERALVWAHMKLGRVSEDDYKNDPRAIKSPMVGTVYLQPEPGANKFVNIGDSVKSGQTILIVEAMKTMNPIESSLQGKVIKILVENEQAVEFGQPLMLIG